jgi:hypothetical protein
MEHFPNICSKLLLWWPFSNGLAFQKRPFVTTKHVTHGKESSITIKESDFPIVLHPECIRSSIHIGQLSRRWTHQPAYLPYAK